MRFLPFCFIALVALAAIFRVRASADGPAALPVAPDLVLLNGKIWTVNKAQPEVEALASWKGRILCVGASANVSSLPGPQTRVVDLKGRRVVPGFYDSHVHL